jgi:hypothetical protein
MPRIPANDYELKGSGVEVKYTIGGVPGGIVFRNKCPGRCVIIFALRQSVSLR